MHHFQIRVFDGQDILCFEMTKPKPANELFSCVLLFFFFCFDQGKWKRTMTICYLISFDVCVNENQEFI